MRAGHGVKERQDIQQKSALTIGSLRRLKSVHLPIKTDECGKTRTAFTNFSNLSPTLGPGIFHPPVPKPSTPSYNRDQFLSALAHAKGVSVSSAQPPSPLQSVATLYRDHHGWLHGWLRKRLGDREQAADIAQDTFLRLLLGGRLPSLDEGRSYLAQIARNLVIDQWRRQRIERAYLDSIAHLPEPESPSLETRAIVIETLLQIDAMLDAMPAKVREAFLLSQFEGLTYPQVAERLQVSVSSVQKYMQRAISACYQVLYAE